MLESIVLRFQRLVDPAGTYINRQTTRTTGRTMRSRNAVGRSEVESAAPERALVERSERILREHGAALRSAANTVIADGSTELRTTVGTLTVAIVHFGRRRSCVLSVSLVETNLMLLARSLRNKNDELCSVIVRRVAWVLADAEATVI